MILYWVTTEDHYEDWFVLAPSPEEATQYLMQRVIAVQPEIIITLGEPASRSFIPAISMDKMHGIPHKIWIEPLNRHATLIPCYHPAAGLHLTSMMKYIREDFENVGRYLKGEVDVWKENNSGVYCIDDQNFGVGSSNLIGVDTEWANDNVWCMQYSTVRDTGYIVWKNNSCNFKRWMEDSVLIAHNWKYDLDKLWALDIYPNEIYDTMIMAYHLQEKSQF